jgi:hypothetical protein
LRGDDLEPTFDERLRGALALPGVARAEDDVEARRGELSRDLKPDAAVGSRDQYDLFRG